MTLEEYMASELAALHRHRSSTILEAIQKGTPKAQITLLDISMLVDAGRWRGEERVEDFELQLSGKVESSELRRLVLAYYEPAGFQVDPEQDFAEHGFFLVRETDDRQESLQVCISNDSNWPAMPSVGLYPQVQVTCTLTFRVKSSDTD